MRTVSSLSEARSAVQAGVTQLCSPPFAACHAGVNYYRALLDQLQAEFPGYPIQFTLCCGDDAAAAHDALRLGFTRVLCDCSDALFTELQAAANATGAKVFRKA